MTCARRARRGSSAWRPSVVLAGDRAGLVVVRDEVVDVREEAAQLRERRLQSRRRDDVEDDSRTACPRFGQSGCQSVGVERREDEVAADVDHLGGSRARRSVGGKARRWRRTCAGSGGHRRRPAGSPSSRCRARAWPGSRRCRSPGRRGRARRALRTRRLRHARRRRRGRRAAGAPRQRSPRSRPAATRKSSVATSSPAAGSARAAGRTRRRRGCRSRRRAPPSSQLRLALDLRVGEDVERSRCPGCRVIRFRPKTLLRARAEARQSARGSRSRWRLSTWSAGMSGSLPQGLGSSSFASELIGPMFRGQARDREPCPTDPYLTWACGPPRPHETP